MEIRLTDHYHSGAYSITIQFDTPKDSIGNDTQILFFKLISEKEFNDSLSICRNYPENYIVDESDDSKNKIFTIKPKFVAL